MFTFFSYFRKPPIISEILKTFLKVSISILHKETLKTKNYFTGLNATIAYYLTYILKKLEYHYNLETSRLVFKLSKTITSSSFVIFFYIIEQLFSIENISLI